MPSSPQRDVDRRRPAARTITALAFSFALACDAKSRGAAPVERAMQSFTSDAASLVNFEFDGQLDVGETEAANPRPLIEAQLMYAVGQLHHDRSVGGYERLELSKIDARPSGERFVVSYHARLPVAWGAPSVPTAYDITVPKRVSDEDRQRFAERYGATCIEPWSDAADADSMFFYFRPQVASCRLAPEDIVTSRAAVTRSMDDPTGKYPEYHRIWEDGALHIVAVFSRSEDTFTPDDEGGRAYADFIARVESFLRTEQPDDGKRTTIVDSAPLPRTRIVTVIPDGRTVSIDTVLVHAELEDDGESFDRWYDASTPTADLIVYNGHSGLGWNLRQLTAKGSFSPGKYTIFVANGCATFAYLDGTLAKRRAALNSDDPFGTKYMDVVSNVLSGTFDQTAHTSMSFVEALTAARNWETPDPARPPKSYRQIVADIDREQVVVVTGEEDNEFQPRAPRVGSRASAPALESSPTMADHDEDGGCNASGRVGVGRESGIVLGVAIWLVARRRLRRRKVIHSERG